MLPQSAVDIGLNRISRLDMSKSGAVGVEESQTRGRKRGHTEAETSSPNSKRPKLSVAPSSHSRNPRNRRDDDRKHRELTPAEKAHEKVIKERSLKYRRGDGVKLSVRVSTSDFSIDMIA